MLKFPLLISVLILFCCVSIGQDIQVTSMNSLEEVILKREERLKSLNAAIKVILNKHTNNIEVKENQRVIRTFPIGDVSDVSIEKIIGFFLNLEESLLIKYHLNEQIQEEMITIEQIDALYEYPFIDETGSSFIYISNKGTGNRNPFILNLLSYEEKEIIIPQTGDYFPVLIHKHLFFLKSVEDGFSLVSYDLNLDTLTEIVSGKINCLRSHSGYLFYSENNQIFKLDISGNIIDSFSFKETIQSFDIHGNLIILSMLNGVQYDLYLFNSIERTIKQITSTPSNEVDVIFKSSGTVIFSSNQKGYYGLYWQNLDAFHLNDYQLIYVERNLDIFYPFYSNYYSKIIGSVYQSRKEPHLIFIQH